MVKHHSSRPYQVVAGAFLIQLVTIGFFSYSVSLLTAPVQQTFHVGVEQIMYSLTLGTTLGLVAMPLGGMLLDHIAVRWVSAAGLAMFGAGLYVLAQAQSLTQYVWTFGVCMACAMAFAGPTTASTSVARWFSSNRGKALGIAATGTSTGGVLIPALLAYWLGEHDWRTTLEWLALLIVCLVLPLSTLLLHESPVPSNQLDRPRQGIKQLVSNADFWSIGIAMGLLMCVYSAFLANMIPYAHYAGLPEESATQLLALVALSGFIGKLVFGALVDKLSLKHAMWLGQLLILTALIIVISTSSTPLIYAAIIAFGVAAGGILPVWAGMIVRVFGLEQFGRAMGLMGPMITLLVMPGFTVTGALYDHFGDFQWILTAYIGLILLSACVITLSKLAPAEHASADVPS